MRGIACRSSLSPHPRPVRADGESKRFGRTRGACPPLCAAPPPPPLPPPPPFRFGGARGAAVDGFSHRGRLRTPPTMAGAPPARGEVGPSEGRRWASALGWLRVQGGRDSSVVAGCLLSATCVCECVRVCQCVFVCRWWLVVLCLLDAFGVKETGPQQAASRIQTPDRRYEGEHQSSHAQSPLQALAREKRGHVACAC